MPSTTPPAPSNISAYHSFLQENGEKNYREAKDKLEAIVKELNAESVFLDLLVMNAASVSSEGYSEVKHGTYPAMIEAAAFFLYPHFGERGGNAKNGEHFLEALKKFLEMRLLGMMAKIDLSEMDLAMIQMRSVNWSDNVRCSAYTIDLENRILQVQAPHDAWFKSELGISPSRLIQLLRAIMEALNRNFCSNGKEALISTIETIADRMSNGGDAGSQEEFEDLFTPPTRAYPASIDDARKTIPDLKKSEWESAIKLIGLTQGTRATLTHVWEVQHRPLYVIDDQIVFYDLGCCLEAAYEAFDRYTRTNQSFRDKNYIPELSNWFESRVSESLRSIFGSSAIHDGVRYADPDRANHEAEIDHIVVFKPFLFLVEDKAKQFRPRARRGDPCHLSTDLRKSVGEAFDQSLRAHKHLLSADTVDFKKQDNSLLQLRSEEFSHVFQISVCLYNYNCLTTQPASLRCLNLFNSGTYPWIVTLDDLTTIARFVETGEAFTHYVCRRLQWQDSGIKLGPTEMDLFCAYLQTRLHPSVFYDNQNDGIGMATKISLSGYTQNLDKWFQAEGGKPVERPEIRLELLPRIGRLFEQICQEGKEASRAVCVGLLDLSHNGMTRLELFLQTFKEDKTNNPSSINSRTFVDSEMVVCLFIYEGVELEEATKRADARLDKELYRNRKNKGITFVFPRSQNGEEFHYASLKESVWERNETMEEIIAAEPLLPSLSKKKRPGRNEPCICGSGKKFKSCCLLRMKR